MKTLIDSLYDGKAPTEKDLYYIISNSTSDTDNYLFRKADQKRKEFYGNKIYIRGLIEISNICKNNCYYCGIRAENSHVDRYRLTDNQILECCQHGYALGFRTFVMQGGEDIYFTDEKLCSIAYKIKRNHPDCALTMSLGERSEKSYRKLREAGVDRYLLRHETADPSHYSKLHPQTMSYERRINCLKSLKKLGFQTGAGFMVGSPYQKPENLVKDLMFLYEFKPQMIGIGPFIPHADTPFKSFSSGNLYMTLRMLSLVRLMLPNALIPSTTALGSINAEGRILGIKAGANVVMPNLSPTDYRKLYTLYNNKAAFGAESAEGLKQLNESFKKYGYEIVVDKGDFKEK